MFGISNHNDLEDFSGTEGGSSSSFDWNLLHLGFQYSQIGNMRTLDFSSPLVSPDSTIFV